MYFIGAKDLHLVLLEMPMQILRPGVGAQNDRRRKESAEGGLTQSESRCAIDVI
jgi:hypothetical protein